MGIKRGVLGIILMEIQFHEQWICVRAAIIQCLILIEHFFFC